MTSWKLHPYFLSHAMIVPSTFPLREAFKNKESTRRIAKWAMELAPVMLELATRTAIKSQVFADFVAEWQAPS